MKDGATVLSLAAKYLLDGDLDLALELVGNQCPNIPWDSRKAAPGGSGKE
jgi:hypothetical protein